MTEWRFKVTGSAVRFADTLNCCCCDMYNEGSADDDARLLILAYLGGSPYLLLALVGRLLMCMVVAVCDGNEGLAAIKNNPDIAMVITDMRYCACGIVRLVVWPLWLCVIVVSNVGINLSIKYIAESMIIGLDSLGFLHYFHRKLSCLISAICAYF